MTEGSEIPEQISAEAREKFEEIFRKSGISIIPPKDYSLPSGYDFSNLEGEDREVLEGAVDVFTEFLKAPIISDNFKTHDERRTWRKETFASIVREDGIKTARKFDSFLRQNKMKRNSLAKLMGYCDLMMTLSKPQDNSSVLPPEVGKNLMVHIEKTLPREETDPETGEKIDPWEGPTTPEKIETINQIAEDVAQILNYLARK